MTPERGETTSRLAAIVFDRGEDPDAPLTEFITSAATAHKRIAGLIQERGDNSDNDRHDVNIRNLTTGARLPVMQTLGRDATGCRVDPSAIAAAARQFADALASRPDLLIANRFGRLESEGGGMIAEIGAAAAEGIPLVISVPRRYLDAWNAFAGGLDAQLPPRRQALEQWWAAVSRGLAASTAA